MVSRRRLLASLGNTGILISTSGCVSTRWWEDEQSEGEEADSEPPNSDGDEMDRTDPAADENEPSSEQEDNESSTEDDGASTQEHQSNEEERQHKPDAEDLEVNEDEYDDHGTSETEERSPADITIEATAQLEKSGGATVRGTVTNVSDEPIDVVDLEVIFYDVSGSYLTADLVSITTLSANKSESFEVVITPDQARGEPDHVDIQPIVYDRSD